MKNIFTAIYYKLITYENIIIIEVINRQFPDTKTDRFSYVKSIRLKSNLLFNCLFINQF